MNRLVLSKIGPRRLSQIGLALVVLGLIAEAAVIVQGLLIGFFSDRTDKILSAIFTTAIALGVWWEHVGHRDASRPRELTAKQREALAQMLKSDLFQKEPKPALRVGAVNDAEAQMYAMQFMRLFESCAVNIYPTDGGLPITLVQHRPIADGQQLIVKSMKGTHPAFVQFQRLVHSLGIAIPVGEDPSYRENEAMLQILKKPE